MISELKPYPKMKDSGVEWLGEVPEHWEVRRLRYVTDMRVSNVDKHVKKDENSVRLCNYIDVYRNDYINGQKDFMKATATSEEIERFRLKRDDVLITKDSETWDDIGVPALVTEPASDLISGYHLALLRPQSDKLTGAYLFRALQSKGLAYQFHIEAKGVTRYGLSHAGIKSVWLPLPALLEQTTIFRFLDQADRRIRRYIRAKQKLIALLEEQKQVIIHQAVTGRIDVRTGQPYPAYKPSGVEWLGDVPAHWEVRRLRFLVEGKLTYGANAPAEYTDSTWPRYLRITDFSKNGGLRTDTFRSLPPERAKDYLVKPGDVLLARSGATVGKAFLVDEEAGTACHAGYLIRARLNRSLILPAFFFAFTQSTSFARWKDTTFIIATIQNIGADKYADLPVPLPPLSEQENLLRFFGSSGAAIDRAVKGATFEIAHLREYRTHLIADVVTGKLDVRAAAAALPEVDPLAAEEGLDDALDADIASDAEELDPTAEAVQA